MQDFDICDESAAVFFCSFHLTWLYTKFGSFILWNGDMSIIDPKCFPSRVNLWRAVLAVYCAAKKGAIEPNCVVNNVHVFGHWRCY
jgi:hypothetical protein